MRRTPNLPGRPGLVYSRALLVVGLVCSVAACRPELTAGEWVCAESAAEPGPMPADPVAAPWSTGFEDRFCGYTELAGFCYEAGDASYSIVRTPVHSGRYAAAFNIETQDGAPRHQARCVRQGALPRAAYYGAWYFIPESAATDGKVWNLFHFQGAATENDRPRNLWDVSLVNGENDALELIVYRPISRTTFRPEEPTPIPIGSWFHIEMYLKRAADETGEIALYQDGALLVAASGLVTDDLSFSEWYVGNYSDGLTPSASVLYVDDVSIRTN